MVVVTDCSSGNLYQQERYMQRSAVRPKYITMNTVEDTTEINI